MAKRFFRQQIHDGIGYSANGDAAYWRGERPVDAKDFNGRTVPTMRHHIEVAAPGSIEGFRRKFVMFYRFSGSVNEPIEHRDGYATCSKNGLIVSVHLKIHEAQHRAFKDLDIAYITPVKIISDGPAIPIDRTSGINTEV